MHSVNVPAFATLYKKGGDEAMSKIRLPIKLTLTIHCPCGRHFTLRRGQHYRCLCGRTYHG